MNKPDTAEGGRICESPAEYRRRIKSAHFFRERNSPPRSDGNPDKHPIRIHRQNVARASTIVLFRYIRMEN
jgi:hypothetical protein